MLSGLRYKYFDLFSPTDLSLVGNHNFRNAVRAAIVAEKLGVSRAVIKKRVKLFRGLPHRLEFVRQIKQTRFYNDSAATNPEAVAAAVQAFPNASKILIAGGQGKDLDYTPLATAIRNSRTRVIILFGSDRHILARELGHASAKLIVVETLTRAVRRAYDEARRFLDGIVLLSPGATSLDQFRDYAARGEKFKQLVRAL